MSEARQPVLAELHRDGLLLTRHRRRAARIVGVIGGIGALLVGTIVGVLGILLIFARVSELPIVAGRILARHRRRHPLDPAWPNLPPADARLIVALHGEAALLAGDPDLAEALGLRRRPTARDDGSEEGYDGPGDGGGTD